MNFIKILNLFILLALFTSCESTENFIGIFDYDNHIIINYDEIMRFFVKNKEAKDIEIILNNDKRVFVERFLGRGGASAILKIRNNQIIRFP